LYSCTKAKVHFAEDNISAEEEIIIDAKNSKQLTFDSLIQTMNFIKLETTEDNLIGKISQILFTDSLIIIVDGRLSRSIQVFAIDGAFKYRIGAIGAGPDEYINLTNVCLVPQANQLSVLDGPQKKILYYTLEGKYVSSERTPFMLYYFEYLESGSKAFEVSNMRDPMVGQYKNCPLIVTDIKNNILYGACHDYSSEKFNFTMNRPLRKIQKDVYFSPNFTNNIFLVQDTSVTAKYHINIKENGMPPLNSDITNELFEEYCKKYFYFNGDFIELADYTYVNILTPWGNQCAVYSHEKRETYLSLGSGNHPFYTFLNDSPKARFKENTIVIDVDAYDLITQKEYLYKGGKFKVLLDSLFENITEDSNPVLFFYNLNIN
jgi:hypothetical protein